jgi:methionyl-tRNA formyltransferase
MNVVFMGTPQFAVVSLKKLLEAKINVVAVVTVPDKQKGRGLKVQSSPVKIEAEKYNIPVLQPDKLKDPKFQQQLQQLNPDLIIIVAFRILPETIFTMPPLGTVNLHGSLLPKYRGAAPINWAIIKGETETGVTTIFIKKQIDTGNIIESRKVEISGNMTAGELHDEMATIGADLLLKTCNDISNGIVNPKIQDESLATAAPKIFKEMCKIDFNQPAKMVHDFIRGLSPYPASFTFLNGKIAKLFGSKLHESSNSRNEVPGAIVDILENQLIIQCDKSSVSIGEIQLEGKRRMKTEDFLRGYQLSVGMQLG